LKKKIAGGTNEREIKGLALGGGELAWGQQIPFGENDADGKGNGRCACVNLRTVEVEKRISPLRSLTKA
jgi:hypothetical protein